MNGNKFVNKRYQEYKKFLKYYRFFSFYILSPGYL